MINIIVAVSQNGVIGKDNKLIWHLPEDLKRFRKLTDGQVVVMGRKTHESIAKSLPNRLNVILTKDTKWYKPFGDNCVVCYSIEEVMEKFKHRDLFIIGGSEIYRQFLNYTDRIFLTLIKKEFEGDSFFPEIGDHWNIVENISNSGKDFDFDYILYQRNNI